MVYAEKRVPRSWRLRPEADAMLKRWSKVLGVSETWFVESSIQIISEGLEESATRLTERIDPKPKPIEIVKEEIKTPPLSVKPLEKILVQMLIEGEVEYPTTGKIFGPFKIGELVSLPQTVAQKFLDNKLAVIPEDKSLIG